MGQTVFVRGRNAVAPIFKKEAKPPFWWLRYVPAAILTVFLAYLFYVLGRVAIIPVLASVVVAYLLTPIVASIERSGIRRPIAALLAMLLVGGSIIGLGLLVIPDLWIEGSTATQAILGEFTERNALDTRKHLHSFSPMLDQMIGYRVYTFLRSPAALMDASRSWVAGSLTSFFATASLFVDLLLVPFFVYYILADFPGWRDSWEELIPPRYREAFSRLFDEVGRILQSYVLGQLLIALMMGGMYAIGFALMRIPAWGGLALVSGLLNFVPYVGTTTGLLLASGLTLSQHGSWLKVLGVFAVFITVQCIEGYILTPRILGARLRLHPMSVFLALLVAGKLFGFLGILLAVPVTAVLQVFWKFLREIYKSSFWYHAGAAGPEVALGDAPRVVAKAADTVLAEQVESERGDELLAPKMEEDDQIARSLPDEHRP